MAGRIAATGVNWFSEIQRGRYYFRMVGQPLTGSEINFFSAYRLHAQAVGETTNIDISDDHERKNGEATLLRFAKQHPEIAALFS